MTELSFRRDLYSVDAVTVAVAAFSAWAEIERESGGDTEILRLTAKEGQDEAELAGELANYVLGATVDGLKPEEVRG